MTSGPQQPELPPLSESWLPKEHALYKPRHGGRQRIALVCALIFFAAPLLSLGVGIRPAEIDNRRLLSFPGLSNLYTQLPQWAIDHLTFRSVALHAEDGVSRGVFGEAPSFQRGQQGVDPTQPDGNQGIVPVTREEIPPAIEGRNGWLYYGDDVVSRCIPAQKLSATIAALQRLRGIVEASGRQFVLIIAPDKSTVVPQNLPDSYPGKQCAQAATSAFWRQVPAATGAIDLRSDLAAWGAQLGHPVYPPQDGHWADEGAITMTRALAEAVRPGASAGWVIQPSQAWQTSADLPPLIGHEGVDQGDYYALEPDGRTDATKNVGVDFTSTPDRLDGSNLPGTVPDNIAYLGDSFTIRALRYFNAAFTNITVMHYQDVTKDDGLAAGQVMAGASVVAVELVERTLESGNSLMLRPEVLDGIARVLAAHPVH